MVLCSECEQFDLQSFRSDRYAQRGYSYSDVKRRAKTCDFCGTLSPCFISSDKYAWIHFELLGADQKRVELSTGKSLQVAYIRAFLGVRYTIRFGPSLPQTSLEHPTGQEVLLRVCADEGSPAATSGDVIGRHCDRSLPPDNRSIETWLDLCLKHHDCRQTTSGEEQLDPFAAPLPTRCINVGTIEESTAFLEQTSGAIGAFITLSHRWNRSTDVSATTAENLNDRTTALDVKSLHLVFQEAIWLTRRLNVKHLWIDSLCIIQREDDCSDWRVEAPKMADYYQRSLLTLSVLNDKRLIPGTAGFDRRLIQLPYWNEGSDRPSGHYFLFKLEPLNSSYEVLVQRSELFSRAWVFQEYLLSRRIAHFSPTAIIFECRTSGPMSDLGETLIDQGADGDEETFALVNKRHFALDSKSVDFSSWYAIVEVYSALRFTHPEKDRTIALSGVAGEFATALAARRKRRANKNSKNSLIDERTSICVEGLWMDHAHCGLLWEKTETGCHAYLKDRPSWSWARLYAKVQWCVNKEMDNYGVMKLRPIKPAYKSLSSMSPRAGLNLPCIILQSRMQHVTVDRLIKDWELKSLFEKKVQPRAIDNHYRALRERSKRRRLCGWASFDHDHSNGTIDDGGGNDGLQEHRAESSTALIHACPDFEGTDISAVHVSTLEHLDGGLNLGYFFTLPSAYHVLMVRNLHDNVFERVGMGCLFGQEVEKVFKESEFQEIVLA